MGFLDYAWATSVQKDNMKTRIRIDSSLFQPTLSWNGKAFDVKIPMPQLTKEGNVSFLGYEFPATPEGKGKIGRLFRASVVHLTAHTLIPIANRKKNSLMSKHSIVEALSHTLVNDTYINAKVSTWCSDGLADLAFANALAFSRMKSIQRIFNSATRISSALLSKMNIGLVKGELISEDKNQVEHLAETLALLKEKVKASSSDEDVQLAEMLGETQDEITEILESNGPVLEAPSMNYAENIGPCTLFSKCETSPTFGAEQVFRSSMATLGGVFPPGSEMESCWREESNAEACQAFDGWFHEREKEERILGRLKESVSSTRIRSIEFPEQDYTNYLWARALLAGGSRRLLDSLRIAQDALDEDPGKEMGQLDLSAVIQVIASNKPATDVFMLDEYLSRSFAWTILFDVSSSMKIKGELSRALLICIAEAAKELLMDSASWTLFGFSDRLYILKDSSESYSRTVRARIGGVKFGGLTFIPDAIQVAGSIVSKRYDEQRFLVVVSDGNPYGYSNIDTALSQTLEALQRKGVIVLGVGIETDRMMKFFKQSCEVYNEKDLIKRFSRIFTMASSIALET